MKQHSREEVIRAHWTKLEQTRAHRALNPCTCDDCLQNRTGFTGADCDEDRRKRGLVESY